MNRNAWKRQLAWGAFFSWLLSLSFVTVLLSRDEMRTRDFVPCLMLVTLPFAIALGVCLHAVWGAWQSYRRG